MPTPGDAHRAATRVLSLAMATIGVVLIASTLARGGGPLAIGVIVGLMFLALGLGRLYLQSRSDDA